MTRQEQTPHALKQPFHMQILYQYQDSHPTCMQIVALVPAANPASIRDFRFATACSRWFVLTA